MAYIKVYRNWLPYGKMKDRRGFISRRYGNGHSGTDSVGNQYDNPVCAVVDGTVTAVRYSETLGHVVEYGNAAVKLAHYHLAKVLVKQGDAVQAGETVLGIEGGTGTMATGKHLHTSMWIGGGLTDPEPYLCGEKPLPGTEDVLKQEVQQLKEALTKANAVLEAVRKAVAL
ncbi:MAG: M23 family metallopeptidase [Clostridia bacterium]|nr:M23 family metallopeptidase [Clostridia bacterium]